MFEYLQGYKNCMDGIEHQSGRSIDYDNGYSDRYTVEQDIAAIDLELEQ
jgi:hypothetical protein